MRRTIFTLCLTLIATASLRAGIVVTSSLDSTSIRIGDQVLLRTQVTAPKGSRIIFPEYVQGYLTQGVEVLERSAIDTTSTDNDTRWILSRTYLLTSFDSALYTIPPVEVKCQGHTYSSDPLGLKVQSVEVDTLHPDNIREPYGPVALPFEWDAHFIMQALGLWILIVVFIICYSRLLKREPLKRRITVTPPPPAHQVALHAIEEFKGRTADSEEELKRYYDELTDVLRTYIKERFDIDAMEMTTPQLIAALMNSEDPTALHDLRELLETADLVKFARLQTTATENDRSLMHAMEYVNQTKSTEVQPTRITKVVDVDLRKRKARIALRWIATILTGIAAVAYTIYLIYILIDTFI